MTEVSDNAARSSLTSALSTQLSCFEPACRISLTISSASVFIDVQLVIPDAVPGASAAASSITNAATADWLCLLAVTDPDAGYSGFSQIIVPTDSPGFSYDLLDKIGNVGSDTGQLYFDNVRVPVAHTIGEIGRGFQQQMMQFQEERLWGAANAIKGCENLIAQTIDYARERQVFGMSLLDNQSVHFKLAELQTEVEMLRALVWQACETYINGGDVLRLASMAKLKAGRLSREVADGCMQYWGGNGFMWDNPASQLYRDGRLGSIGGGADEVMLGIICKTMGMLPGKKKNS